MLYDFNYIKVDDKTWRCELKVDNLKFYGESTCHPEDLQFISDNIGKTIAQRRAVIAHEKYARDLAAAELRSLNDLYYSMKMSRKFNKDSYEAKRLFKHINDAANTLSLVREMLKQDQLYLISYLKTQEKIHSKLRVK